VPAGDTSREPSTSTTVLFMDIVRSTAHAATLGDRAWADVLHRYKAAVRAQLTRFDGTEMDDAGDGFFAVFGDPAPAVACAQAVAEAVRPLDLEIRAGAHAGNCIVVGSKCTGLAVHIGARLVALAEPGEIVVSERARHGVAPGAQVVDRGLVELRDVPGEWRIFAVTLAPESTAPPKVT